jgi:hypothetical protein
VNPACEDELGCIFFRFFMSFPDLDQESRSGILVYLIRGSLVNNAFSWEAKCAVFSNVRICHMYEVVY